MTQDRWHPPPPPSTPREAPWRQIEELIAGLSALSTKIDTLSGAMAAAYGIAMPTPVVTAPTPAPTPISDGRLDSLLAKMETLIGAISAPAAPAAPAAGAPTPTVPYGMRYGTVSGGDTSTLTQRVTTWETNMWQGWEVEKNPESGSSETRVIISNTADTLTVRRRWDTKPKAGDIFVIRPRYPLDNPNSFITIQKDVTTAGTQVRVADHSVPNGWPILMIAKPGNSGSIFWAASSADVLNTAKRWDKLEAGKSVAPFVSNTNLIWLDTDNSGDGVSIYVPQLAATS